MPDYSTVQSAAPSSAMHTHKHIDKKKIIKHTVTHFFLVILCIIFLLPIFYMVTTSLMSAVESGQGKFIPTALHFENYVEVLSPELLTFFKNTAIVVGLNVIFIPFSALFTAFAFVRCKFVGQNILFTIILSTMMIPAIVCQIPMFVVYVKIGWLNTLYPLTIPNITGGGAIYIFLARSFLQSIPKDIDDAAKIDGAGSLRRYFFIGLPLCKPILIYIMINVFTSNWGDYYGPLVWRLDDSFPATLAYKVFYLLQNGATGNDMVHIRMAAGVIMSLVPAVLFFIFQKQLIEGVAMDGLKG